MKSRAVNGIALVLATGFAYGGPPSPGEAIVVGARVEGEVLESSPLKRTAALDAGYADAEVRGVSRTLVVEEAGPVTVDLRSYFFDAYLVLEDPDGVVIAEDDDGLANTQARVVASLEPGRYAVVVCALHGGVGPWELVVRAGAAAPLRGPARRAADIEDGRRRVAVLEGDDPEPLALADALNRLGFLLWSDGRFAEAEPQMRRALAIKRARFGEDHPWTAFAMTQLAAQLHGMGRCADAQVLQERALAILEAAGEPEAKLIRLLASMGSTRHNQGHFEAAEALLRRSSRIAESIFGADHLEVASILFKIGQLYLEQGKYADAERVLGRAVAIHEASSFANRGEAGLALHALGASFLRRGSYARAEALIEHAVALHSAEFGEDHVFSCASVNALALVYQEQGRLSEAEPLLRRVLATYEAAFGDDHHDTATALHNLAIHRALQGAREEAEQLSDRAIRAFERSVGERHPGTALAATGLMVRYFERGRYADGRRMAERALAIRTSVFGERHPDVAGVLIELARGSYAEGRVDDALAGFERAAPILEETVGPEHGRSIAARMAWAQLLRRHGRHDEAWAPLLTAIDRGQAWVLRELAQSPSHRRFSIAATQRSRIDQLISERLEFPAPRPPVDEVYRRVCAWKGVAFRHVARLSRTIFAAEAGDPEVARLRDALANLDGQLSVAAYSTRIADADAHGRRVAELRARRIDVERALLARLGIEPQHEATDGAELSRLLPPKSASLDFVVHRRIPGAAPRVRCFVTVAGAAEPTLVDLGAASHLRAATDVWLDRMTKSQRGAAVFPTEDEAEVAPAEMVKELLFDPILAVLPAATTRLFVIPDDFLGEVPFGAISLGGGRYVLEAVDVVYATDPVTLRDRLMSEPLAFGDAPSILAVGDVDYDGREESNEAESDESRGRDLGFQRAWGPLSGTAEEVDGLSRRAEKLWPDDESPRVLKGIEATEEQVKALAPGRAIVHLATHGFFEREGLVSLWEAALAQVADDDAPLGLGAFADAAPAASGASAFASLPALDGEEPGLLTGLALAGANLDPALAPGREDGILTATEVAALDLSACRLALLSACQTALGTGRSGEGLQSLRRGFHEAGARTVVASLWKVDDAAAQRLMRAFYEELWSNGRGVADALRRAKLKLLREDGDPYYWAAFTLSGEWR